MAAASEEKSHVIGNIQGITTMFKKLLFTVCVVLQSHKQTPKFTSSNSEVGLT